MTTDLPHGAGHDHSAPASPVDRSVRTVLACCLAPLVCLTLVGAVLLWPSQHRFRAPSQFQTAAGTPVRFVGAQARSVTPASCGTGSAAAADRCLLVGFALSRGGHADVLMVPGPGEPAVHAGDRVTLAQTVDDHGRAVYYFDDFRRSPPLLALGACFVLLAVVVGRRRGLFAILGLGVAFAVLVEFVLPALLSGRNPLLVALDASAAVMIVVLYLGHGVSARTTVAVLGTLTGIALVGGLGALAVTGTHLTGLSSDDLTAVQAAGRHVDVRGLLVAGLVIGSLGVLNDVTVTQASAVWELYDANPALGRRRLYAAALRIGRDHIGSSIYTLLLAYAGAALPVLLLFTLSSEPFGVVASGDLVASDIVRSLVGAIGLLATVPLTTAAAVLARTHRRPPASAPNPTGRHRASRGSTRSWSVAGV